MHRDPAVLGREQNLQKRRVLVLSSLLCTKAARGEKNRRNGIRKNVTRSARQIATSMLVA